MQYDKDLVAHKLRRWDRFITDYHLPEWETIPDFGLYMDQVIVLLEQYLSFIPSPAGTKEHFVTSSTINNYVRLKIMPAPVKRKYFRVHIAYLIMILTVLYIDNRYSSQQELIEIDKLKKDLIDIKYDALTRSSELMEKSRQSRIEEYISTEDSPLQTATNRPYLIKKD